MITNEGKRLERTISGIALALLAIGCILVLWPFISAVVWAIVLTFASWPVYRGMLRLTAGRRTLAAGMMTITTTLVLLVPFVIVGFTLADNVKELSAASRQWIESGPPAPPMWLYRIPLIGEPAANYWQNIAGDSRTLLQALARLIEPISAMILSGGLLVGQGIVQLGISIFIAFFLYRDGVSVAHRAVRIARRLGNHHGEYLLRLAGATVRSVVRGILGTALAQALLAGIGYALARVPGAALLAMVTFFLAVTPIGPPLVYIPVALWLFGRGSTGWAIFMIAWGVVVSSVDNVLKPWLISHGSDMPFLLIFFGVIGGALAFGFIGVFLGPTLLAVGYRLILEWTAARDEMTRIEDLESPMTKSE